jgi:hypothetical protein
MKFSKYLLLVAICFIGFQGLSQKKKSLGLTNVVVIGQMDNQEDRYSVEVNLTQLFASKGIKATPSLNIIKQGADSRELAGDSLMTELKAKGYDTYMLVTVRGYDRKFKVSDSKPTFEESLERANLFEIYAMDIVSVSFECKFYRSKELIHTEMIKVGNVSSRSTVLSKLRKKIVKLLDKRKW